MAILDEISEFLQKGRAPIVKEKVQAALDEGISAKDILEKGLLAGMGVVGEKFKNNEVFVPEVLIAARAMNMGVAVLKPYLAEDGVESKGTAVIGTVKGDLHDIGKNLVKMMLELVVNLLVVAHHVAAYTVGHGESHRQVEIVEHIVPRHLCRQRGIVEQVILGRETDAVKPVLSVDGYARELVLGVEQGKPQGHPCHTVAFVYFVAVFHSSNPFMSRLTGG